MQAIILARRTRNVENDWIVRVLDESGACKRQESRTVNRNVTRGELKQIKFTSKASVAVPINSVRLHLDLARFCFLHLLVDFVLVPGLFLAVFERFAPPAGPDPFRFAAFFVLLLGFWLWVFLLFFLPSAS